MQIHQDIKQLPSFRNAVLTIGTFDGVHIAHKRILQRITELAQEVDGESVLVTFHPHPRLVLQPQNNNLKLLSLLEEKFELLAACQLQHVVVVPFSKAFAEQSPEEYVSDFLVGTFQPKKIVIGYNHQFGKERAGNIHLLREMGQAAHFEVEEISKQIVEDIGVSSTKIRNALLEGAIDKANHLLGYAYRLSGEVIKGKQLGHTIGFPTANVKVADPTKLVPADGVYAVNVRHQNQQYKGMLNIGKRPTVDGQNAQRSIEVNIFDFDQMIYGEKLQISFTAFIRKEQKFESLAALKTQLSQDKVAALKY